MYQLRDEHIDAIMGVLQTEGIEDKLLFADLLDHISCYIEEKMETEQEFYLHLREAIKTLAPQGLKEIEKEKFLLFHFNKQISMKKSVFFSGFAATFFTSTGITFKMLYWPGANVLLMIGFFCLFAAATIIFINAIKHVREHSKAYRFRIITGVIAAFMIAVGGAFKIVGIPSANILCVSGFILLNFIFLPMLFLQLYRNAVTKSYR